MMGTHRSLTIAEERERIALYEAARREERIYTLEVCARSYRRRMQQSLTVAAMSLGLALAALLLTACADDPEPAATERFAPRAPNVATTDHGGAAACGLSLRRMGRRPVPGVVARSVRRRCLPTWGARRVRPVARRGDGAMSWLGSLVSTPRMQAMAAIEGLILDLTEPAYGAINRSRAARARAAETMRQATKRRGRAPDRGR